MIDLEQIVGFEWDDGNSRKSADKHAVSQAEAEGVFFNDPLILVEDLRHSDSGATVQRIGKDQPKSSFACHFHTPRAAGQ